MLIRIIPEQIREKWEIVRPLIAETLPPVMRISAVTMANVLKGLLLEKGQMWLLYGDEPNKPKAMIVTTFFKDQLSGTRALVIYSLYAVDKLDEMDYIEGIAQLRKFAIETGCTDLIAYVADDVFLKLLRRTGAEKITNLVRL